VNEIKMAVTTTTTLDPDTTHPGTPDEHVLHANGMDPKTLDPKTLYAQSVLAHDGSATRGQWIDVRSASEYATGHIAGSMNIPLEQIDLRVDDLANDEPIVLICKAGTRARMAAARIGPCGKDLVVLEGGTDGWIRAGYPVVASVAAHWSLERQVRLGAGVLVALGVVLSLLVNSSWIYLSGFVGLGLVFAGLTDICPMGMLLAKMPWNRGNYCAKSGMMAIGK
jgi:rhodanese-related sulfurtransferase